MKLSYYGSDEKVRSFAIKKTTTSSGRDHIKDCYTFNGTVKIEPDNDEKIVIVRDGEDIIRIDIMKMNVKDDIMLP